jgi:hypothetical protein
MYAPVVVAVSQALSTLLVPSASGDLSTQKLRWGSAATTACTPPMMVALLLKKRRVSAGPDVDTLHGCADAVTGFTTTPDTLGTSDGDDVDGPSYTCSTSAPASVATAVSVSTSVWPAGAVNVWVQFALLAYTGPALVVTGSTWREASATVAPEELHMSSREMSHTMPRTPAPLVCESLTKRSVSALPDDSRSVGPEEPLIVASDRLIDDGPSNTVR